MEALAREYGASEGVAYVFFHACPGCAADWDPVVARSAGARVIPVDLPDHGAAPEATDDAAALERAVAELVASIEAPSLVLVGAERSSRRSVIEPCSSPSTRTHTCFQ